jgi:hypothetical protein
VKFEVFLEVRVAEVALHDTSLASTHDGNHTADAALKVEAEVSLRVLPLTYLVVHVYHRIVTGARHLASLQQMNE